MKINLKLDYEQLYLIFGLIRKGLEIKYCENSINDILLQLRSEAKRNKITIKE